MDEVSMNALFIYLYTHVQKKGNTFQKSTKTLPLLLQIGNLT